MSDVLNEIFKAYDIRGKVGKELNPEIVSKIGQAFAEWLPKKGIVAVGYDMRPDSHQLATAFMKGLSVQGRDVLDIGQVTSDMIYFAVGKYQLAGGAMITASHNPGEYNGIKLCREEAKPVGEESGLYDIRDSVKKFSSVNTSSNSNTTKKDITKDWIQHVLSFIDAKQLKPLSIAVDAGNGMAGRIFPSLESFVPFKVKELFFELDGTFPNHIANPLDPKNLIDLQKVISGGSIDAGIAFDGDGDRAVLVDEKGVPLSGTVLTAILSKHFLENHPNSNIICNAICGRVASETVETNGGKVYRSRVGHSFIKADMRKYKAVFGGEHSGHYYFKDNFMADSGLIAAVIALSILSKSDKKLSELAKPYRTKYLQITETNFEVKDKHKVLMELAKKFNDGDQDWLDGLTVNYPECWFNVRPSNTEPLLRLNAEAKTKYHLDSLVTALTNLITRYS